MKLHLFVPPLPSHPKWTGWVKWACSISRSYVEAAALLNVDKNEILRLPREDRPLGPQGGSVPVVWTAWGWLEGVFQDDGVFVYECDTPEWRG